MNHKNIFFSLTALSLSPLLSHASSFSAGAGVVIAPDSYRGDAKQVFPLPVINFDNENFFFHSLSAGYKVFNDQQNKLNIIAFYNPLHLNPDDTNDSQMEKLDKRHSTLMGGLAYSRIQDWGTLRFSLVGDLLGHSNGIIADVGYLHPFDFGNWSITPGAGVTWNSANQNQYYYGVSQNESKKSGFDSYDPSSSINQYVELTSGYKISHSWRAYLSGRVVHLNNEVTDSPIVDKNYSTYITTGITYAF